jgi:hypothetical protein
MHEAEIKAFPAPTGGKGDQVLAPRLEANGKAFDLTASVPSGASHWLNDTSPIAQRPGSLSSTTPRRYAAG